MHDTLGRKPFSLPTMMISRASQDIRTPRLARRVCALWALLLLTVCGCPATPGGDGGSGGGNPGSGTGGYVAVIYLNYSSFLAQPVVALAYRGQPPMVWVNSVTPKSWESLLVDCGLTQMNLVGVIPVDLATGTAGQQVDYTGSAFVAEQDIACGSVVVVEINDAPAGSNGNPITITARTIPDPLPNVVSLPTTSPLAPGPDSGFVLLRPQTVAGVTTAVTASWQTDQGLVYVLDWRLAGQGPGVAALMECPVEKVGWGNVADAGVSGAVVGDSEVHIAAPPPLLLGTDFQCGDAVTLLATGDAADPATIQLSATANGSRANIQSGQFDLFGHIRTLLDQTGFAGKLSNSNALLPPK